MEETSDISKAALQRYLGKPIASCYRQVGACETRAREVHSQTAAKRRECKHAVCLCVIINGNKE